MKIKYLFLTAIFLSLSNQHIFHNDDYYQKFHLGKLLRLVKNKKFMAIIINEKLQNYSLKNNQNFSKEKNLYKKKINFWLNRLLNNKNCLNLQNRKNYEKCYFFADSKLIKIFGFRFSKKFHPKKYSKIIEIFLNYLLPFQKKNNFENQNNFGENFNNYEKDFENDFDLNNLLDLDDSEKINYGNSDFQNSNKIIKSITNHHVHKIINKKHIKNHKNINNITVNIYINNPENKGIKNENTISNPENLRKNTNIHNMDLRVSQRGKYDIKKLRNFFKNGDYKKDSKKEKVYLPIKNDSVNDISKIMFDDANQKLKNQKNYEKSYEDLKNKTKAVTNEKNEIEKEASEKTKLSDETKEILKETEENELKIEKLMDKKKITKKTKKKKKNKKKKTRFRKKIQ